MALPSRTPRPDKAVTARPVTHSWNGPASSTKVSPVSVVAERVSAAIARCPGAAVSRLRRRGRGGRYNQDSSSSSTLLGRVPVGFFFRLVVLVVVKYPGFPIVGLRSATSLPLAFEGRLRL